MNITDVITQLIKIRAEHGDVEVHLYADMEGRTMDAVSVSDAQKNHRGDPVVVISGWEEETKYDLSIW